MAGPEFSSCVEDKSKDVFAIYEDTLHKSSPPAVILSGPELASMMKIGTRVVRGVDWKWGDQVSILFYFLLSKGQNTNCGHMRGVSIW
jgi:E3 ubiquitin-protein ligase HERC2